MTPWQQALRFLGRREYTRLELETRLKAKGVSVTDAKAVVEQLVQEGWLDEARYLESALRYYQGNGYGPKKIIAKLRQKGLKSEQIREATGWQNFDWTSSAQTVLNRKFDKKASSLIEKGKQSRFLVQRGFEYEQILQALENFHEG